MIKNWRTRDKPLSAQLPQLMPKVMDADCTRCKLFGHITVPSPSKIPATHSIANDPLQE